MAALHWEAVKQEGSPLGRIRRAQVPGGWLVVYSGPESDSSIIFYPDPEHTWEVDCEVDGELPQGRNWDRR